MGTRGRRANKYRVYVKDVFAIEAIILAFANQGTIR